MFKDNLTRILSEKNKNKKISQRQLARLVGVAPSSITEWLKGRGIPNADKITKLAEVLGVQVSDLIDEPQPTENTNISNSTFNNSVAINKGSITINGLPNQATKLSDIDTKLLALPEDKKKLVIEFFEFLESRKI